MKKILISLFILLPLTLMAEISIGGEVKGGATTALSKRTEDSANASGEYQEMETSVNLKGSIDDFTSANIKLKATQNGLADGSEDNSERSFIFVDEAYFKTDIAKYAGFDLFSIKLTAGLFRVEPLRLARMSQYKNEDISATEHFKANYTSDLDSKYRVRIDKLWDSPNVQLDIGLPIATLRAGMSCHENEETDAFQYLAGLYGRFGILSYEAFYYSDGGEFTAATDDEDAKTVFDDAIYGGLGVEGIKLGSVSVKTGVNYMYRLESEKHDYGVGMRLSDSTLIPLKLNMGLNGVINGMDEVTQMNDLSFDLTATPSKLFKVQTGVVLDLREYEDAVVEPSLLRIVDTAVTLTVKKTEIGLGYAHIFNENSLVEDRYSMFSHAEKAGDSHIYLNFKTKF